MRGEPSAGKTYYYGADGQPVKWEQKIGGHWYYFNGSGVMQTGWVTWSKLGTKSYFNDDGKARTGWHTLWGKRYYFDPATARSLRWENRTRLVLLLQLPPRRCTPGGSPGAATRAQLLRCQRQGPYRLADPSAGSATTSIQQLTRPMAPWHKALRVQKLWCIGSSTGRSTTRRRTVSRLNAPRTSRAVQ